jgi:hypothetical protein
MLQASVRRLTTQQQTDRKQGQYAPTHPTSFLHPEKINY